MVIQGLRERSAWRVRPLLYQPSATPVIAQNHLLHPRDPPPLTEHASRYTTCCSMAVRSIRHRGLRRLWETGDQRGVPAQSADKLRRMLAAMHRMSEPGKLAAMPGWRLHRLTGDRAGLWSLTVSGNWRLVFRFEDGDAFDLDLVDYH